MMEEDEDKEAHDISFLQIKCEAKNDILEDDCLGEVDMGVCTSVEDSCKSEVKEEIVIEELFDMRQYESFTETAGSGMQCNDDGTSVVKQDTESPTFAELKSHSLLESGTLNKANEGCVVSSTCNNKSPPVSCHLDCTLTGGRPSIATGFSATRSADTSLPPATRREKSASSQHVTQRDSTASLRFHSVDRAIKKKVVFCYLANKLMKYKKRRRYWVHPFNGERLLKGVFTTMMIVLREDENKFFSYFRMSIKSFDELAARTSEMLKGQDTVMRVPVPPLEMLAVTLRYLGSGCSMTELHNDYRLGQSTICKILRKVCAALWSLLQTECFPPFTSQRWLEVSSNFYKRANFPHCLGALYGKHVWIRGHFSIVLFAMADASYNFLHVDVGTSEKDSTIFESSSFHEKLINHSLDIPGHEPLPSTAAPDMPYVFVADEAFGLSQHIMRPYKGRNLTKTKKVFNYRLGRAHRYVQCTFALLSNKWKIFQRPMNVDIEFAVSITQTCCLLHNYVLRREGYIFEDSLIITGLHDKKNSRLSTTSSVSAGQPVNAIRSAFAKYFESDGQVPWQDRCIR